MYLLGLFLLCAGLVSYRFEMHTTVANVVISKYKRLQALKQLVSTRYRTNFMILWVCFSMIAKMFWLQFLQWSNTTVQHLDKKTVIVSYVLNGKLYKLAISPHKGPPDILLVLDDTDEDITDLVLPFLGPENNWHGKSYAPNFWKKKSITMHMSSGDVKTFLCDEIITV